MSVRQLQPLIGGWWVLALALTAACSDARDRTGSMATAGAVGTSGITSTTSDKRPIELSGCLQKSNGSYVVTETSRRAPNGALRAYRLQAGTKNGKLEPLVGKHVRVSGLLVDRVDPMPDDDRRANDLVVGTSGTHGNDQESSLNRARIASGEPARIEVTSVQPVAERCGTM
jgi:hypothetical protein